MARKINTTPRTPNVPALWADLRNPRLGDLPEAAAWGAVGTPQQGLLLDEGPLTRAELDRCENPF